MLVLAPNWAAPSERWLTYILAAIGRNLVAVAANNAPQGGSWGPESVALRVADGPSPAWRRVGRRLGLPVAPVAHTAEDVVLAAARRPHVDVICVHYIEYALRFERVWQRVGKPLFVHSHGYDAQWDLRTIERPDEPYFPPDYVPCVRKLAERAIFIANPECARRLRAIGVDGARIVARPYGVPVPVRPPPRPMRSRGLEVLYVGRLAECKGPDLVIRAFERACDRGLDARLTLAGGGELWLTCELLRRRSRHADRIRVLGAVDQARVDALWATADLFTLHHCVSPVTRQVDACPVVTIEAQAAALPVISARCGGVTDLVVDGATGVLVEPGDVESHADALLALARDPAKRLEMGRAGWHRARTYYDIKDYGAVLRAVLGLDPAAEHAPHGSTSAAERPAAEAQACAG